jgi:hypothetical protein
MVQLDLGRAETGVSDALMIFAELRHPPSLKLRGVESLLVLAKA